MEQDSAFEWPPLESNGEVFTDYLKSIGVPEEWIVNEVFGLDEDCLGFVPKPVLAVIATFENVKKGEEEKKDGVHAEVNYYMKQTKKLDMACGVIACIHSVLNNLDKIKIADGSVLHKYYSTVKEQSPQDRALTLENMKEF
jgi:ubiquitin carboxyl-terminal hydrolase L3